MFAIDNAPSAMRSCLVVSPVVSAVVLARVPNNDDTVLSWVVRVVETPLNSYCEALVAKVAFVASRDVCAALTDTAALVAASALESALAPPPT